MILSQSASDSTEVYYGIACAGRLLNCWRIVSEIKGEPDVLHAHISNNGEPLKFKDPFDAHRAIVNNQYECTEYFPYGNPPGLPKVIVDTSAFLAEKNSNFHGQGLRVVKVTVATTVKDFVP